MKPCNIVLRIAASVSLASAIYLANGWVREHVEVSISYGMKPSEYEPMYRVVNYNATGADCTVTQNCFVLQFKNGILMNADELAKEMEKVNE